MTASDVGVAVWNRQLSADEVDELHKAGPRSEWSTADGITERVQNVCGLWPGDVEMECGVGVYEIVVWVPWYVPPGRYNFALTLLAQLAPAHVSCSLRRKHWLGDAATERAVRAAWRLNGREGVAAVLEEADDAVAV